MTKITIEVPSEWGDVVPGSFAADQVVEKVKELVLEKRPSRYEEWRTGMVVMQNVGYMNEDQRQLAANAPQAMDALVAARAILADIVDDQTEDMARAIDKVFRASLPQKVAEEVIAAHPIRGQVTEFTSDD